MSDYTNLMKLTAGTEIFGSLASGISSYYEAKRNGYLQQAQLYSQATPQLQQMGGQARQVAVAQGLGYLSNGVDPSQGTAKYVINKTIEQSNEKINDLMNNYRTQSDNINKISSYNATAGLMSGIANAGMIAVSRYAQYKSDTMLKTDDSSKKENLFIKNTAGKYNKTISIKKVK